MQDRSGQKRDLEELVRLGAVLEASGDLAYEWDLASDTITWFGNAPSLFGADDTKIPRSGDALNARISPEDLPYRMRELSEHFAGAGAYDCEFRLRGANGEFHWVHDRGRMENRSSGAPAQLNGVMRVVTSRKKHEEYLEFLANFDELTGHFNKIRLREALEHALAQSNRSGQSAAFLMVGIDQLGMINSAYGFEAGDAVLVEIAHRLDRCLRTSDVIGRPSGDRFGVILTHATLADACSAAERILLAFRTAPVWIDDVPLTISASIGIVGFPQQSQTSFDVMTKAESAMTQAKAKGRDCAEVYDMTEEQRRDYRASMTLGEEVKSALRDNRLLLAFQPVVDAASHSVRYHECLARMFDRSGTLVPAARFIPVVEQLGLMRTIDRHVLGLAVETLEQYPEAFLAINISGLTATDRSWLRVLISTLKGRRHLAERLMVEITETAALQDIEESARFVAAVRALGAKVALDDFGAGYTTFRHIKALTVDVVKIDGSFVRGITTSEENRLFIRNLVSLARTLGLKSVAECVETSKEANCLKEQGVDLLQGYYFGKPDIKAPWQNKGALPHKGLIRSIKAG